MPLTAQEKEAMIWGGLAGGVPVLSKIAAADPSRMFLGLDAYVVSGHVVIVLVLMVMGALVVRLNGETVIAKAFQLGIMAPAILVGLQSGVALSQQQEQLSAVRKQLSEIQAGERPVKVSSVGPAAAPSFFIATAHAKGDGDAPVPKGEHRKVGVGARFWYGVTGSLADGWFVIAGSHKDRQSADAQAAQLRSKGWNVVVGDSLVWGGYYAVQVGSYLPKARAEEIRIKAIDDGLPKDTFTWHR